MAESQPPRDLPQVPDSVDPAIRRPLSRVIEEVQRLLEFRGDPLDAALTTRKAIARGLMDSLGRSLTGSVTYVNTFPGGGGSGGGTTPDLTPPPTVTGLTVVAGFTQVLVQFDAPVYSQGHGNLQTNIYASRKEPSDPTLPTFGDAVLVFSAPGALNVVSIPSELNTRWHVWAKYKTVDGVESVTAAGGVNGVVATTGQDIVQLLEVLTGSITESQLYTDLGQEIDLIKELSEGQDQNAENTLRALLAVQDVADGTYAAILEEKSIRRDQTGALFAQWTVKLDVNGYVSGFGLASTSAGATPYSSFIVRADSFAVASPSGPGIAPAVPFIVRTTPGVEGGVPYTAGVYMVDAFIQNGSIVNAKIANLAVDDAKVASMSVAKLTAGSLAVGQHAQSTGYVPGSAGWRINGNGTAEFSGVIVRGAIYAAEGLIGGNTIDETGVESPGYSAGSAGWRLDTSGLLRAFASSGTRVLDLAATGTQPVLKIGSVLELLANGDAFFGGRLAVGSVTVPGYTATGVASIYVGTGVVLANGTYTGTTFTKTGGSVILTVNIATLVVTSGSATCAFRHEAVVKLNGIAVAFVSNSSIRIPGRNQYSTGSVALVLLNADYPAGDYTVTCEVVVDAWTVADGNPAAILTNVSSSMGIGIVESKV